MLVVLCGLVLMAAALLGTQGGELKNSPDWVAWVFILGLAMAMIGALAAL